MDIEIVAIGNELLLGETVDTNSAYAAHRLAEIGARVSRVTIVGDNPERMRQALAEARDRSRWVITTGGLGPTQDDLTRQVVAELFDAPLEIDAEVLSEVEERFRRFGYAKMPESNRSQAEVPRGARVIPNRHGTAPGLVIEGGGCTFFVLPGVPAEMRALLEEGVLPAILAANGDAALVVRSRTVHTAGIGESALAERLQEALAETSPIEVAFLPDLGMVDLRLTLAGYSGVEADRRLDALAGEVIRLSTPWFYGVDGETLPQAIGRELAGRGWKVAVAESMTSGELGAELTSVAGSSAWFVGGILAYANEAKEALLDVPRETLARHGAVSEETCRAMLAGVRRAFRAEVACAVTGIAGPAGGSEEKPVGLVWIGVETPAGIEVRKLDYPGGRRDVRRRATVATLALLWRQLRPAEGER
ncbi:MAG TPA: competence/damage-inducible protein A [Gemmatimonadota bacterium]|nr:competence/damage-inducible protein A [Gemmatimonadota bacterium]